MTPTPAAIAELLDHPDRLIELFAVHNFRDVGGYPTNDGRCTAWRKVFRADGLYRLTPEDVEALRPFGLRTVIDLRTSEELSERGTFPVDQYDVEFHHLSIIDRTWDMNEAHDWKGEQAEFLREKYHLMLQQGGHLLGEALRILSNQDNGPVVFHCAAGKDRTGLLAALLLSGLGVPDEIVYADYAMSELAGEKTREWAKVVSPEFAERFATMPPVLMSAHPDSIKGLLADIRESHGTIRDYCLTIGVEAHHWDALEDHLLETL